MILGIDVARWQNPDALPYPAWVKVAPVLGVQVTHGTAPEPNATGHLAHAVAAGYSTLFAYHWLTPGNIAQQIVAFLAALDPAYQFCALDVEQAGVSAQDVVTWVRLFVASCHLPLVLYGNNLLAQAIAAYPELKQHGVWYAGYPTFPAPCTTPPFPTPRNVPAGLRVVGWQYAGNNGVLPPYAGAIDLTTWYEIPGVPMVPDVMVPHGSLVAIHAINPGNTLALVKEAAAAGAPYAAVKMLNDAEALAEVKQASPTTWTYLRYYNPADDSLQGLDNWTTTDREAWCDRVLNKIYSQITAEQCKWVDWACAWNEEDPPGPFGYKDLGETFLMLGQKNEARKSAGQTYVKLAFGCLAQGTPELWEMDQLIATGLFAWMRAHFYSWDVHEGWYPRQTIEAGIGDALPSDPFHNYPGGGDVPAIPGSGSGNFRFVWMFEQKLRPLGQLVPLLIGEWYPAVPLGNLERYWWYDDRASAYEYLTGFAGYNLGPTQDWPNLEDDYQSAAFKQHRLDVRNRRNGVPDMPNISDADYAALVQANAQATAILQKYGALPWWQLLTLPARKATAVPNKVLVFRHLDGSPITPNPRTSAITYQLDVFAVNVPGALLLVTDPAAGLGWWVAAGDLSPA